jgi:hypothetical protein
MSVPTIAVLTCERSAGNYLSDTLRQIEQHGGRHLERHVFVDGPPEVADGVRRKLAAARGLRGWSVMSLGERLGSTEATRQVFIEVARRGTDLLFFEDDLLLCTNAVTRMLELDIPPAVSLVSFFDMKEVRPGSAQGLYRRSPIGRDRRGLWGNQCFRVPADVLLWLCERNWRGTSHGASRMASDVVLGELLAQHPTRPRIAYHIPCLVEHVGHGSACFPGLDLARWRRATNFPGREFDALGLPSMP